MMLPRGVPAQTRDDDGVESGVGAAVAASIEPSALNIFPDASHEADTAQGGEGCFVSEAFGVVASGDEQSRGGVGADAVVAVEQVGLIAG